MLKTSRIVVHVYSYVYIQYNIFPKARIRSVEISSPRI